MIQVSKKQWKETQLVGGVVAALCFVAGPGNEMLNHVKTPPEIAGTISWGIVIGVILYVVGRIGAWLMSE